MQVRVDFAVSVSDGVSDPGASEIRQRTVHGLSLRHLPEGSAGGV